MESAFVESDSTTLKRTALIVALLTSFLTAFMGSAVSIALPTIGQEFSMTAILLGWTSTAYLLAAAMFLVPFGRLSDMYGRKRILTYGISLYTISSLISAISNSGIFLIVFRAIQGIGGAMIFGTGVAILLSVYPPQDRGRVLGINVASTYIGLSIGPFLGGILTQYLGWRSLFYSNVILGIITLTLILWKLEGEWVEAEGESFDWIGSILFSIMLTSIMYGFTILPDPLGAWLISGGIGFLVVFIWWEKMALNPVLNMNLFFRNRVFAFSSLAALINYGATFAVAFLLSLYLQYTKGLNPQDAGLILVSRPIFMASFSPLAGRISDRIEPRLVASSGMAVVTMGLILLAFISERTSILFIVLSQILLGFGFALFSSPNTNAMMSSVEKRVYGVASATVGTMRLIGQVLSMGIATLSIAIIVGPVEITPAYYEAFLRSVNISFFIFAGLCLIGIFASAARGRMREAI
jgi:EmrB/QacA subfamily drug resistance transporter